MILWILNSSTFSSEATRQERPLHSSADTTGRGMDAQCPQQEQLRWHWATYLKEFWLHTASELGIVIPHRLAWPSDKQNITLIIFQFPLFPATLFKVGEEHQHDNLLHDSLLRLMSTTLTLTEQLYLPLVQPWDLLHLANGLLYCQLTVPPAPTVHVLLFWP